jgi:hypothetical protein
MLKSSLMCLLALGFFLAATQPASAGAIVHYTGSCSVDTSGNTHCFGSLQGIRNDLGDPSGYVSFAVDSSGTRTFAMGAHGVNYSCSAPSTMSAIWNNAVNASGVFSVTFNNRGVCTFVRISSESADKNGA